jgi:ribosomal protein S12 methylthiotransferase
VSGRLAGVRAAVVTLGCDKNLVDAETMLGKLRADGAELVGGIAGADLVVLNTCAFIADAVSESYRKALEISALRRSGAARAFIVTGCMPERFRDKLPGKLPDADAFLGTGEYDRIADTAARLLGAGQAEPPAEAPRVLSTAGYAFLKIAEGCDNRCAYCKIPAIRGRYKSRPIPDLAAEAEYLARRGAAELVLVAQDTTEYGRDIYGGRELPGLIRALSGVSGVRWIRLMYCYPERVTPELIAEMASNPKVCRYIDMPVQHVSDSVLAAMGRRGGRAVLEAAITALRAAMPDIAIRTTLMTGFPGETEEDFETLKRFVRETRFDRLGVFAFSPEKGTAACRMGGQVERRESGRRRGEIMRAQQRISAENNREMVGSVITALVTGAGADNPNTIIGRTYRDAPDVDGAVIASASDALTTPASGEIRPGAFVRIKITGSDDYDLFGDVIGMAMDDEI